eukprot:scaffold3084_cov144-Cylindrotheca_fusiformis.AAC.21
MAPTNSPYKVKVSHRFLAASLFSAVLLAFTTGRTARILILSQHLQPKETTIQRIKANLPNPVLKAGKPVPQSQYSSKHFDTTRAGTSNSRWMVLEEGPQQCSSPPEDQHADFDDDEVHLPKGQHYLLDIRNVDSSFLASELRLVQTMIEVINSCGLTLLSYHCHGLLPSGVSCVGVLLESHVSFHTWPSKGVITFDLFTCGDSSLLPIVPTVERLFSVPQASSVDGLRRAPESIWAYKMRGFGDDSKDTIDQLSDLFTFPIGMMTEYKKEIVSVNTEHHRVDIYDVLRPHFQLLSSWKTEMDGSYEAQNPELFEPDRILFIDGVLESRRSGEASFYEALIHPPMFAHPNPKKILVFGGGYGAHLRELLKHVSVEKVVVVQNDEMIVNLTKTHFPEYDDCTFLQEGRRSCFDDSRVHMIYRKVDDWLGENANPGAETSQDIFDVIIADDSFIEDSYNDENFVGEAPEVNSPPEEHSHFHYRHRLLQNLLRVNFEEIRDYEEAHMGAGWQTQFLIAFKDFTVTKNWFRSEASINLEIRTRTVPSKEETRFQYFDGGTMQSYVYPTRFSANVFCRRGLTPDSCKNIFGINVNRQAFPLAKLVTGNPVGREFSPLFSFVGSNRHGHSVTLHTSTYIDTVIVNSDVEGGTNSSKSTSAYDPAANRQPGWHSGTLVVEAK